MKTIDELIEKLNEIKVYYPDMLIDVDKLVLHFDIKDSTIHMTLEKN